MILGEPLKIKDIQIGKWVHLNNEAASHINSHIAYFQGIVDYDVVPGCYYISNGQKHYSDLSKIRDKGNVCAEIYLMHEKWDPQDENIKSIHIALNKDGSIILGGALLLEEALHNVIYDLDELIQTNNQRFDCVNCRKPLNIISPNLKICKKCEEEFNKKPIKQIQTLEYLDIGDGLDDDNDTDPVGVPWGLGIGVTP